MLVAPAAAVSFAGVVSASTLPRLQHDHPVGVAHLVAQMRRPEHGDGSLRAHAQHELEEIAAALRVEPHGSFVHQAGAAARAAARAPARRGGDCRRRAARSCREHARRAPGVQLRRDAGLRDGARDAVQAGMEQEIGGDRELEVERGLLEHDAEPRQRRHGIA